ncbi:hypothetical protein NBRC116590_09640 [Pelagimonas sp. KU-00592-HH]|uniref:hypothetical protein n=1 Tax=Roseobacteraceae TaxID=2854170 RepID=UPI0020CDE270|nr:hypothetical protein [Shimia sp. CNT1-13L.2]MCP9480346.1 hypothetical protein [Shimia sp. CNT1-13L.2]
MKRILCAALLAAFVVPAMPEPVEAGVISRACNKSDRKAASRRMCRCMQQVADQSLSRNDQKLAATFFKDPHKAQEIRQSDRRSHERFWLRYKDFGSVFAASCGHLN